MEVNVEVRDGVIILKPNGRIIGVASGQFQQVIKNLLQDAPDSPRFLFNFADVSRMDSTGLGALIGLHVSIVPKGGRIGVVNTNGAINDLLVIGRVITIFEQFASEDEAIEMLQG